MMRGRKALATAVRHPAGHIVMRAETLDPDRLSQRLRRAYLLRGVVAVWEMLVIGMRSLNFSARVQMAEADGSEPDEDEASSYVTGSMIFGLALGVALFFVLPLVLTSLADASVESDLVSNIIEGGIRMAVFIAYLGGIGFLPDIRRVWMYHGAEHKTINALEAGERLTTANVQRQGLAHPRCGTAFLVMLVVISDHRVRVSRSAAIRAAGLVSHRVAAADRWNRLRADHADGAISLQPAGAARRGARYVGSALDDPRA